MPAYYPMHRWVRLLPRIPEFHKGTFVQEWMTNSLLQRGDKKEDALRAVMMPIVLCYGLFLILLLSLTSRRPFRTLLNSASRRPCQEHSVG